jgi:hypothetical protein
MRIVFHWLAIKASCPAAGAAGIKAAPKPTTSANARLNRNILDIFFFIDL